MLAAVGQLISAFYNAIMAMCMREAIIQATPCPAELLALHGLPRGTQEQPVPRTIILRFLSNGEKMPLECPDWLGAI